MVAERGFAALFVARIRTAKELHISLKFFCSYGLLNQQVFIENCLARKDDLKIICSTDIRSPRSIDSVSISSSHQPGYTKIITFAPP